MFFCSILIELCLIILQRESTAEKHNINPNKHVNGESEIPISQQDEKDTLENLRNHDSKTFPSVVTLAMPDTIQQDEIAITSENQEKLTKGTALASWPERVLGCTSGKYKREHSS